MFLDRFIRPKPPQQPIDRATYLALEGQINKRFKKAVKRDAKGGEREYWKQLLQGLDAFSRTGETPYDAYLAMRELHMQTKAESDALYVEAARTVFPGAAPAKQISSEHFGAKSEADIDAMMAQLAEDGITLLPNPISRSTIDAVVRSLDGCVVKDDEGKPAGKFPTVEDRPRVFFSEPDLLKSDVIRKLIMDPLLIEMARRQLSVEPIFESVSVFHTRPHAGDGEVLSKTAQMYHIDRDRLTFLNIFIYLNDIDEQKGPHWFVKTSHTVKPDSYWDDRRFSDKEIESAYSADKLFCVTGIAGTAFAANTSAFHKGSAPTDGTRTLLQIRFCSSLFGVEARWREARPFTEAELKSLSPTQAARLLLRFGS